MRRLSESEAEELRLLTGTLVLEVRAAYLRSPGANVMKHWDQILSRMRSATRRCVTVEEWTTELFRGLNLGSPSSSASSAMRALGDATKRWSCVEEWLDLMEREATAVIAEARLRAEERSANRAAVLGGLSAVKAARDPKTTTDLG